MQLSIGSIATSLGAKMPFSLVEEGAPVFPAGLGLRVEDSVAVEGVAKNVGGERIEVSGNVVVTFVSDCHRCLGEARQMMVVPFAERYECRNGAAVDQIDEDTESYFFSENTIDLTAMLRDNLLLFAPSKMLCREDCRGLCPHCGVDRNIEQCSCAETMAAETKAAMAADAAPKVRGDNPFAILAQWISDDEEVL